MSGHIHCLFQLPRCFLIILALIVLVMTRIKQILLLLLLFSVPACQSQSPTAACCRIVIVRSTGPGRDFQPSRLGVYKKLNGRLNHRPVYKHVLAESFLFFWDYDDDSRWVSGDSPSKGMHGIEAGKDAQGSCVDQLGPTSLKVKIAMVLFPNCDISLRRCGTEGTGCLTQI